MAALFPKGKFSLGLLFKTACNEIPEVVGAGIHALVGIGLCSAGLYHYYKVIDGDNRKHKFAYTVIRHDDPRAATVRTGING